MALYHDGELDGATAHVERALDTMKAGGEAALDSAGAADAYNNLGVIYCKKAELERAAECLDKSLTIWRGVRDTYGLASSHNNLGLVHHRKGDLDSAQSHFEESLELFERLGNLHGMARVYDNLSQLYMDREQEDKAMDYVKKAVAILSDISVDKSEITPEIWQSGAW
jgi:tetratricopeptide (TPR) repeat protein